MRCYIVEGGGCKRVAGTNADARETKQNIVDQTGVKKKDVTIEPHDIPTSPKQDLIEYINELMAELDEKEGNE